jgi:nitrite reductase/ring-hydroxylating ferredoxin subunit
MLTIAGLHITAAVRSRLIAEDEVWINVGDPNSIPENKAMTFFTGTSKIAVYSYADRLSAVSNYCRHQGGPLGEGEIVDGCITCPWHGYQYYPHNGCSPPPFDEKIETYNLKIEDGALFLNTVPMPPGTAVEPLKLK